MQAEGVAEAINKVLLVVMAVEAMVVITFWRPAEDPLQMEPQIRVAEVAA